MLGALGLRDVVVMDAVGGRKFGKVGKLVFFADGEHEIIVVADRVVGAVAAGIDHRPSKKDGARVGELVAAEDDVTDRRIVGRVSYFAGGDVLSLRVDFLDPGPEDSAAFVFT